MQSRTGVGLLALALFGCTNPASGSSQYKPGELGNGGFLFKCDDSVACDRWSTNNARDFPQQIATGAVFRATFVASGDQGINLGGGTTYEGATAQPVSPYMSATPDGNFTTVKPGYGVI